MNLWLRMLYVYLRALVIGRLAHWNMRSDLPLHVALTDLDTNLHMNNGRYLTVMDLGRFDLLLRTGLWDMVRKTGSVPILSAAQIRYRRPLNWRARFTLTTQLIGWDEKWVYIEQRFIFRGGDNDAQVAAIGLVKGSFYDPKHKRTIPTAEIMRTLGEEITYPPLPDVIVSWQQAEESLRQLTAQQP